MKAVKDNYIADNLRNKAASVAPLNKALIKKLKKVKSNNLDATFNDLHEKAFQSIDCLDCGNCCKTIGPRLIDKDIERLSRVLKMKPSEFTETYLKIDEDNDFVFKSSLCPFLGENNYCHVYDHRPKACREYPHTDSKKMNRQLKLVYLNSYVCPAVYDILDELRSGKL